VDPSVLNFKTIDIAGSTEKPQAFYDSENYETFKGIQVPEPASVTQAPEEASEDDNEPPTKAADFKMMQAPVKSREDFIKEKQNDPNLKEVWFKGVRTFVPKDQVQESSSSDDEEEPPFRAGIRNW